MFDNLEQKITNAYRMDETECVERLLKEATLPSESIERIQKTASDFVNKIRQSRLKSGGLDAFLQTYDLSSEEGVALMCLAEALLRIPDKTTIDSLIREKIGDKEWAQHLWKSHSLFVNASTFALMLTGKVLSKEKQDSSYWISILKKCVQKAGEPIIRPAILQAMKILGRQFVMAETIEPAIERAKSKEAIGYRYSYDMLGEAAKTAEDAVVYFQAYQSAIEAIAKANSAPDPILGPGISVKLSALHPRYEWVKQEIILRDLLPTLKKLALLAKTANIGFTIDAEEADRLELSLILLKSLAHDPDLAGWEGLGLAVQAYQKRASFVIDWIVALGRAHRRRFMVRLVKGAYWDSEIKWTQERGLKDYPVFTRKSTTDVCFLACAKKLFAATDVIYPQFATHNAYTVSAVLEMAGKFRGFEFQCLQGMGDPLYDHIVGEKNLNIPCRVYAPVGGHEDLLAYLVRRLLENGANTSFVNRILDEKTPIETLIQDPVAKTRHFLLQQAISHPDIPLPKHLYGTERPNSTGVDLSNTAETTPLLAEVNTFLPQVLKKKIVSLSTEHSEEILRKAEKVAPLWERTLIEERANCLEKMAELLEKNKAELLALLIREGGKTVLDAISEVREAIDYCWYYRSLLQKDFTVAIFRGPTGEHNQLTLRGRGVIAYISPWNFPVAIFLGQITAALASGNVVIAKPASSTPLVAVKVVELLHQAGIPKDAVQLFIGSGSQFGNYLIADPRIQGVMFTGGTDTARGINLVLANRAGPIVPFIAETGGQNAMIVDSSALPEQVVTDVITSAFNSAGQRCSALRVLFIQEDVAEKIITMLQGAMAELTIGDPFDLATDVGPVIDEAAAKTLKAHAERMQREAKTLYECVLPKTLPSLPRGVFFAPRAYEIKDITVLTGEVFGPILHVIRYPSRDLEKVIDSINNTGYGLTLGIHSRIHETVQYIHSLARVGNTYVNRNMIGAVVGVQPFGGEGLSGTGPKAGGPHILQRLTTERVLSENITAAGGNITLMSLQDE